MKPRVERLVNNNSILIVGHTRSDTTCATPLRVITDIEAQLMMFGKRLVQELNLTTLDLEPCPLTIITLVGGIECVASFTKEPLHLILYFGRRFLYLHLSVKSMVTYVTNYDLLVGQ